MKVKIRARVLVAGGVAALAALGGTAAALASAGSSTTARTTAEAVPACPYVADGGSALALVTVQSAHGNCASVNLASLGQLDSYSAFSVETPAEDPQDYPVVAGDAATDRPECRVNFPGGVTVTVYATGLDAVQPMVCAALHGVPAVSYS